MKLKILITILIFVAIVFGYVYFSNQTTTLTDTDFSDSVEYVCAEGKTLGAAFADGITRVSLSDKRVFTLEQVSTDDESGTKFANDGDQIVFWVKDDSAFLEEVGATTYAGCRVSTPSY
ncbi:MAG: hypothetical protein A2664_02275 [Candidatus Taylorbacteria bacterium RIFCSPHIGHO2_01_FULL_46_22b]|uniref:C-type lysozyme inhibitor domain-containing protein n=1 Tax=Candidatus Taylorbacteria bacterium RIFCSPHIGHO2_01_FULL_46_22b TaxID=1802301 RepID=A0A1G2M2Y5_9BACT|nr:MAG: hypothetical protein A2664_02275 [Candidatus Taylorbacteria bacterium RIFCSPHIGHO2_01_FULL_46_22b]